MMFAPTRLLQRIDEVHLASLLALDIPWQSLVVTYAEPRVERLWIPYRDGRLYLHRIHPCETPLWHPHPWPSAAKVLSGEYIHTVGVGDIRQVSRCTAGCSWDMSDPQLWHSIQPLRTTLTLMVTGSLYSNPVTIDKPEQQAPLNAAARDDLLTAFRQLIDAGSSIAEVH